MKEVLARQGFGSFVRNAYRTGAEIDLRANHRVTTQPVVCECKARGRPLDANAVKIFFAEWYKDHATDERVYGFVMSLSGYTGTTRQWHSELDAKTKQYFALLDADDLIRELAASDAILDGSGIVTLLRQRFDLETIDEQWLTYSEYGLTWLIKYRITSGDRLYTIVGPRGDTLPTWKTAAVAKLLRRHVRDAEFFGLDLRRRVQLELFKNAPRSRDELVSAIGESVPDISAALALLAAEGRVLCAGERYVLSGDVVHFVNVAREFTVSDDAATFLSSAYTQSVLTEAKLIRYIDDRYRLGMEATERDAVVGLMRISPSALRHVLFSDPARSLRTHAHIHEIVAKPEEKARWLTVHRQSLLHEALFRAVHDLTHEATDLSAHLGALGVKRFRIVTKLVAVGDPWKPLRVESEHNIAIAKAGAAIEAGALITYSDPAEFHLWDGILNLHAEEFALATSDFTAALEAAVKADDAAKTNVALNNLALVLMRQKEWAKAMRVLAKIPEVVIETHAPYTNMIICLMELGRQQEAEEYVAKTLARFPEAENADVIKRFRNGWPGSAA